MGTDPPVTGVVLAGGESSRFSDGHKAAATLYGEPVLERVVAAVRAGTDAEPVLAFRTETQREQLVELLDDRPVRTTIDDPSFSGPLAGLYGSFEAFETPWLFLCACDMPLISATAVRHLSDRRTRDADAVIPVGASGEPEPLHALYRRESVLRVRESVPATAGVRSLVSHLDEVVAVPFGDVPAGVDLERSTTNVNTRADLARLEQQGN